MHAFEQPAGRGGILVLNSGSSSLKFALYAGGETPRRRLEGKIDRIGMAGTTLSFTTPGDPAPKQATVTATDETGIARSLLDWLATQGDLLSTVGAVGHRVVHGMSHTEPVRLTTALLAELRSLVPLDPDHLPMAIGLMEAFMQRLPGVPHVACFDTAFHAGLPQAARQLAIPRRYLDRGIRRYGFHGISYAYLMEALGRCEPRAPARHRVVLAHLGSGASMAAVLDGRSIDTSMGFTPSGGLPMGTRSGNLDPGVAAYLARTEQLSATDFFAMASHESGLLGVSGTSADMRDLLEREATDGRAAEAIALFCYQAKKCVGAYAAALGGLDTLVFSGGIGEGAATVRSRICEGLGFLGISLDADRNAAHRDIVSDDAARAVVRVIRTDEERMIFELVVRALGTRLPEADRGG